MVALQIIFNIYKSAKSISVTLFPQKKKKRKKKYHHSLNSPNGKNEKNRERVFFPTKTGDFSSRKKQRDRTKRERERHDNAKTR